MDFVGKIMSLHFTMLSRLVIDFLPSSKHLLILWLPAPSAVIWEPKKIVCHCFHCFPKYLPWSDGTRCQDLHFFECWALSQLFHTPLSYSSRGSLATLCFLSQGQVRLTKQHSGRDLEKWETSLQTMCVCVCVRAQMCVCWGWRGICQCKERLQGKEVHLPIWPNKQCDLSLVSNQKNWFGLGLGK